jgi:PST family polysaccharide transporter
VSSTPATANEHLGAIGRKAGRGLRGLDVATGTGLGQRALVGAAWSVAGATIMRVGGLLVGIVAARLLDPQDFGVYAVSLVVYTFIGQVAELGLHSALLRATPDEFDSVAPTALTLALVSYSALGVGLILLAPVVAAAFGTPEAVDAMRVLSACIFLGALASVPNAQLRREFRMAVQTGIEAIGLVVSSVVLVTLAVGGHGAMSLAWSRGVGQLIVVVGLQLVVSRRYLPGFSRRQARDILVLGLPLVAGTLVGTLIIGVNTFAIARMSGAADVGVFNLADTVSAWPLGLFLPILLNVGLPLFAQIRHDPSVVQEVFTRCVEMIVWVFWPVSVMLAVLAPHLVELLYGTKWLPAAAVIQALAFAKLGEILVRLCIDVTVAAGQTRQYLWVQMAWLLVQAPAVWWAAARWGVAGVAWANLAVMFGAVVPMYLVLVRPAMSGRIRQAFVTSAVPAAAGAVAGAVAYVAAAMASRWHGEPWATLVIGALVGGVVYLALTVRWLRSALARARTLRDMSAWRADS